MSVWWKKKGKLCIFTCFNKILLVQCNRNSCSIKTILANHCQKIPASLPGSQPRPPDFPPPEQSTPAINPRAFPALSTDWKRLWDDVWGCHQLPPLLHMPLSPLTGVFYGLHWLRGCSSLSQPSSWVTGAGGSCPHGRWGQEAAGGGQEPAVINGTIERVTPLWFQLTPELCSDKISWLPTNFSKIQMW